MITRLFLAALLACGLAHGAAEEVPYVTTPENVALAMLEIARVGPADYLIDLGSGDGRIVITAAKRFGARGLGVEIVPELVEKSRANARAAGVDSRAHFRELDLFQADLSPASVITMYLLPEVNLQLRPKLLRLRPGTRIVSHDWDMGDWKPDRTVTLDVPDKAVGAEKRSRVHLWIVPAQVDGVWCATDRRHKGMMMRVTQAYQAFQAELLRDGAAETVAGHIDGALAKVPKGQGFTMKLESQQLEVTYSTKARGLQGAKFTRSRSEVCR
jgi:SAM-dependent methyltransferase